MTNLYCKFLVFESEGGWGGGWGGLSAIQEKPTYWKYACLKQLLALRSQLSDPWHWCYIISFPGFMQFILQEYVDIIRDITP